MTRPAPKAAPNRRARRADSSDDEHGGGGVAPAARVAPADASRLRAATRSSNTASARASGARANTAPATAIAATSTTAAALASRVVAEPVPRRDNAVVSRPQRIVNARRVAMIQAAAAATACANSRAVAATVAGLAPPHVSARERAAAQLAARAAAAYGHQTNAIRVVAGALRCLTVSWLGALEGSHIAQFLANEYLGAAATFVPAPSVDAAAPSVAPPCNAHAKRALCCVAVRQCLPSTAAAAASAGAAPGETRSAFQVIGVLSQEEPVLELTFRTPAGVGAEIALFYTPGFAPANNAHHHPLLNQHQQHQRQPGGGGGVGGLAPDAPPVPFAPLAQTVVPAKPNSLINPRTGELKCSLCVEMCYGGDALAVTPLAVEQTLVMPADDAEWQPLRGWVGCVIRDRRQQQPATRRADGADVGRRAADGASARTGGSPKLTAVHRELMRAKESVSGIDTDDVSDSDGDDVSGDFDRSTAANKDAPPGSDDRS